MKSTKKWFAAVAVVALSSTLAFAVPGEGKGGKHGRGGKGHAAARFEKLNLTDSQKQQIKDLQASFRNDHKGLFEASKETRRQIREASEAGDNARAEQLKATAKSQHAQLKQLRDAQEQRIASLLTTEQRAQWEALKAERQERRGDRGGHRRGGRN